MTISRDQPSSLRAITVPDRDLLIPSDPMGKGPEYGWGTFNPPADRLLYARADLVRGPKGAPLLLELELCEPTLFLRDNPPPGYKPPKTDTYKPVPYPKDAERDGATEK